MSPPLKIPYCEPIWRRPQNIPHINTVPRGPVAAMFHSPGPVYLLPTLVGQKFHDPRSVHPRGPAFPFGIRHKQFKEDIGPGPCHFPHPKMLRDGREGIPKFTMLSRHPEVQQFQSPGPAAYKPTMKAAIERPPEFTFGTKHLEFKKDNIPAPNQYTLPTMLDGPRYTIAERLAGVDTINHSPGPGTYKVVSTNHYKTRPPQYTMAPRVFIPGDRTQKPGPGAHCPELVTVNRSEAPHFTFGIRHSQYEGVATSSAPEDTSCF